MGTATRKPNYEKLFNYQISQPVYYTEDNSIPVYDLNFNFLDTIKFSSPSALTTWIENNKLEDLSGIAYNTTSIKLDTLFEQLLADPVKYSETDVKNIIQDLIAQLDIYSSIRFLPLSGHITKLNEDVISSFINDGILSEIFGIENIKNIYECFTNNPYYIQSPEVLPQNIMLNCDLRYPLTFSEEEKFTLLHLPSTYFNILHLKNNRTPHYNIDYTLENTTDRNAELNDLFDDDDSYRLKINTQNNAPFQLGIFDKVTTSATLISAAVQDNLLAETHQGYSVNYPRRLLTKINDYLEPFNNYHINNNKLTNFGELLRNS